MRRSVQWVLFGVFVVLFALGADMHHLPVPDWGSRGDTRARPGRVTDIRNKICDLAEKAEDQAAKPRNMFTFDDYYRLLEKADSIKGEIPVAGMMAGDNCVMRMQRIAMRNHEQQMKSGYQNAQAALDSARIAHKNRTNPDWRADKAENQRELWQENIPAAKSWALTTYLRWVVLFFFYTLIFWREDKNIQRFGWFAALVYAVGWPVTLWLYIRNQFRTFARWAWFETRLRQAQEDIFAPLSGELKQTAWQFAQSSKSISKQREEFRQAGVLPNHSFAASLAVTLLLVPSLSLAQPQPDAGVSDDTVAVVQTVDLHHADTGGGGPPTAQVAFTACISALYYLFVKMQSQIKQCGEYKFSWPDPPPEKILKVPISAVAYP